MLFGTPHSFCISVYEGGVPTGQQLHVLCSGCAWLLSMGQCKASTCSPTTPLLFHIAVELSQTIIFLTIRFSIILMINFSVIFQIISHYLINVTIHTIWMSKHFLLTFH